MAFSDAFLRGQQIATQAQERSQNTLKAIMNRKPASTQYQAAVRGGAPSTALDRVNAASAAVAAEEDKEWAKKMTENQADLENEQLRLSNELTRRAIAETPTVDESIMDRKRNASREAYDRAIESEQNVMNTRIIRNQQQDVWDAQTRNRARQGMVDSFYRNDPAGMTKFFRGAFPGMGGGGTVTREDGATVTAGQDPGAGGYPTFDSDGEGNMYVRWPGSENMVPFGPGELRQFSMASSPTLESKAGGGGTKAAPAAGAEAVEGRLTPKEQAEYIIKKQQNTNNIHKTAIDYANAKVNRNTSGEAIGPPGANEATPEQWKAAYDEGMKLMGTQNVQKALGWPSAVTPLKPQAAKKLAQGLKGDMKTAIEEGRIPDTHEGKLEWVNRVGDMIKNQYGWPAAEQWFKMNRDDMMPPELSVKSDIMETPPDFGTGKENVVTWMGEGMGAGIDTKTGHVKYYDVRTNYWRNMPKHMQLAFRDMIETQVKQGAEGYAPFLDELDRIVGGAQAAPVDQLQSARGTENQTRFGA